jgi:hypothetical protein
MPLLSCALHHEYIATKNTGNLHPKLLTLSSAALQELLGPPPVVSQPPPKPKPAPADFGMVDDRSELPRIAYSMREPAEILGISYITVHRLIQRGLLRSSLALRTKLITRKEIERFLAATTVAE